MGLFGSKKDDKLDASKKVTGSRGEKILKYMDPKDKQKVKQHFKELGAEGKSYKELADKIKEEYGSQMKEKFEHAAKKYEGGGLTLREKRRNIARRRRSSESENTGYKSSKQTFAAGDVQTKHRVSLLGDDRDSRSRFAQKSSSGGSRAGINAKKKGGSGLGGKGLGGSSSLGSSKRGGGRPLGF